LISGVSNVTVTGGTLEGDRKEHKGESSEWGFGIRIDKDASHIVAGYSPRTCGVTGSSCKAQAT